MKCIFKDIHQHYHIKHSFFLVLSGQCHCVLLRSVIGSSSKNDQQREPLPHKLIIVGSVNMQLHLGPYKLNEIPASPKWERSTVKFICTFFLISIDQYRSLTSSKVKSLKVLLQLSLRCRVLHSLDRPSEFHCLSVTSMKEFAQYIVFQKWTKHTRCQGLWRLQKPPVVSVHHGIYLSWAPELLGSQLPRGQTGNGVNMLFMAGNIDRALLP